MGPNECFSNIMIALRILHLAYQYKVSILLIFMFKTLTKTLDWGPLFNWGPWDAALKALALIWHCLQCAFMSGADCVLLSRFKCHVSPSFFSKFNFLEENKFSLNRQICSEKHTEVAFAILKCEIVCERKKGDLYCKFEC